MLLPLWVHNWARSAIVQRSNPRPTSEEKFPLIGTNTFYYLSNQTTSKNHSSGSLFIHGSHLIAFLSRPGRGSQWWYSVGFSIQQKVLNAVPNSSDYIVPLISFLRLFWTKPWTNLHKSDIGFRQSKPRLTAEKILIVYLLHDSNLSLAFVSIVLSSVVTKSRTLWSFFSD